MGRYIIVLGFCCLLGGCAVQRAVVAHSAQEKMVGLSKEQILACMGPPGQKMAEGATEVWSYNSGNDRVTAIGTGYSQTNGSINGQRTGTNYSATGSSTTTSINTATASRRSCTVNVVMSEGAVSRVNYSGPTGGILTGGEQCAFAVESCTK